MLQSFSMEIDPQRFKEAKVRAQSLYKQQSDLYCPYFKSRVIFNSDGFHHLQFSSRKERTKKAQLLKFSLLPLALEIIRQSGTVQEYRKAYLPIGKPNAKDRLTPLKEVEFWGFTAIVGQNKIKVRTIVRRVGSGNHTFWSVMPDSKIRNGQQKLAYQGIEDE